MKPRIVLLSAFLTPLRSGAEACVEEVPLQLADEYDFTIITAKMRCDLPRNDTLKGTIPVVRVGFGFPPARLLRCLGFGEQVALRWAGGFDKWLFPFLAPLAARRLKPDIVHAVLETFAGLALHFCKWIVPGAKRILTLQTTNRSFLKKTIVRSPDMVTAISTVLAEFAQKQRRDDVITIANGIHTEALKVACERMQKVPGRVLFVGRLEKMKGVDVLLKAFSALTPGPSPGGRGETPQLRIVGSGSQRAVLEKLAKDLGVDDRVTFTGYVSAPQIYDEYAQAQIFCGLSRSEGLGNVFLEAQAAGCAVIGTKVGGIPDIIEDGATGLLIEPDAAEAASEAISTLLRDDGLRSALSSAGREHAQAYDWQEIARRYEKVYRKLTEGL